MTGRAFGHYRVLDKLGEGGMGVVYKAEDTALGRPAVIKVIGAQMAADTTARARLLREARTASALNHPNICTIYEVGEAEGQAYIAMEFIEGKSLSVIIGEGAVSLPQALRYAAQITDALVHAHERGVVHRDLKGANVIVTPAGLVKVLDFGLAKRIAAGDEKTVTHELTQAGTVVGTLSYMAPELLKGVTADERSDLWALGVMLYEMIAGALPFQGTTVFETTSAILREPPPPLPPGLAPPLRAVVERLLAKEPEQRYQKALEVRGALELLQSGTARGPVAWRPGRREALAAAATTGAALAGFAGWKLVGGRGASGPLLSSGGPPSANPEANDTFERAFLFLSKSNEVDRALPLLEKALQIDPRFAEARAWYGFTLALQVDFGLSDDLNLFYRAEKEIQRALEDNPNLARGYSALAGVFWWQCQKDRVPEAAAKALRLNPNDIDARIWLSVYHQFSDDYDAAERETNQVLKLDRLFMPAMWGLADIAANRGDLKRAFVQYQKCLDQVPDDFFVLSNMSRTHMSAGNLSAAREALARVPAPRRHVYHVRVSWGLLHALEGRKEEARKEVDAYVLKLLGALLQYMLTGAEYYTALGETETAMDWLERAVRSGDERANYFRRNPLLAPLRRNPRFDQIVASTELRRKYRK